MKPGTRVRMSEALKARMRGDCLPGKHIGPFVNEPDEGCLRCSTEYIVEFGECEGIVQGLLDYNNVAKDHPDYDPNKVGPEVDIRWQPSNLRYGHHPDDLEVVTQ